MNVTIEKWQKLRTLYISSTILKGNLMTLLYSLKKQTDFNLPVHVFSLLMSWLTLNQTLSSSIHN